MSDDAHISRRTFVGTTTTAALAFTIVPRHVLGRGYVAPSDRLDVAVVGAGGMGMSNMTVLAVGGENVVAVCDVDYGYVERSLAGRTRAPESRPGMTAEEIADQKKEYAEALTMRDAYAKAKKFDDFRVMLDKERELFTFAPADQVLHDAFAALLTERMEPRLSPRLYSYRRGRSALISAWTQRQRTSKPRSRPSAARMSSWTWSRAPTPV